MPAMGSNCHGHFVHGPPLWAGTVCFGKEYTSSMLSLEDVTDYRDLLKDFYEQRKRQMPLYSYRMMGGRLGLDASQLFRILQKEQHLPARCLPVAKELLGLTGRSAGYFDLLVAASRTRSPAKRKETLDRLFSLRDVERRALTEKELRFLGNWWNAGLRALLEVTGGKASPRDLAERLVPPIPVEDVEQSLELLKELGLVKKLSSGRLAPVETHLTASGPEKAKAVHAFQRQALQLAAASLDAFPSGERDISTLTMGVDAECFEDLRSMLREFRRQVQKRVEESARPDRVMQMTMTFFPLAPSRGGIE